MSARVVVVDSCPTRRREAADRLAGLGCDVVSAPSGYNAIHALSSRNADLIIVNWSLEDMMLHEFAEHVKHIDDDCVLMVSFDRAQPVRPRGLDDPYIDGWIPYDGSEQLWRSTIERASRTRRALMT